MCGIYGFISTSVSDLKNIPHEEITQKLSHRGPDAFGFFRDKNLFLGHTRLSIIDEANGIQPMTSISGNSTVTYNGEIYNTPLLQENLKKEGVTLRTNSDTEVLVELFDLYGIEKTLDLIEGMFCFAAYSKKDDKTFIARDRIGEKFLYYARNGSSLAFGSEIKVVLETGIITDQINEKGLYEYLCRAKISGEKTIYRDVLELKPGHYLEVENSTVNISVREYWSLMNYPSDGKTQHNQSPKEKMSEMLKESTNSRMLSDVKVGLLISGGLDSSYLAGQLAESGHKNLKGYCAGNYLDEIDESPYAKKCIDYINDNFDSSFELNVIKKKDMDLKRYVPYLTYIHDEPLIFLNSMQLYEICKQAHKDKTKVLISGEGADEIFCGYHRHVDFIKRHPEGGDKSTVVEELYYGGGLGSKEIVANLCKDIKDIEYGECWEWLVENKEKDSSSLILLFDQLYRLQILLQRQDRIGMATHVELRQPFLNYNVFDYANSLDVDLKYSAKENVPKKILKEVAKDKVPLEIIDREKTGFPSDLFLWFDSDEGIDEIESLVFEKDSISTEFLNSDALRNLFESHRSTKKNNYLMQRLYFLECFRKFKREQPST